MFSALWAPKGVGSRIMFLSPSCAVQMVSVFSRLLEFAGWGLSGSRLLTSHLGKGLLCSFGVYISGLSTLLPGSVRPSTDVVNNMG